MSDAAAAPPRRWPRRLAWAVAALLLLCALALWALPALLLRELPARLGQALGRPVNLQDVGFVPWRLELTLTGLQVGAAPGQPAGTPPLLQLAQLRADLSAASLRHRAPVIEALALDGLRLHLARTAPGHYDIDDLIARLGAPAPATEPAGEPARFALHNLSLRDAQLRLDDRPAGRVHDIQQLSLDLPLLSNLPADVATHTDPRLRFTLQGTRFDSGAHALPFAATRSGELTLRFDGLDLAPWQPYLPAALPLRLARGRLSSDLTLRFSQPPQGQPSVALQGRLALRDVAVTEPGGAPLLGWRALDLELRDVQPLARRVTLGTLAIDGASVVLSRDGRGRLNLQRLLDTPPAATAPATTATATAPAAGNAGPAATGPGAPAWQLALGELTLRQARLHWTDDAVRPRAALQLDEVALQARALRWPDPAAVPLTLQATLRQGAEGRALGTLAAEGEAEPGSARLALRLADLDLTAAGPYLAPLLRPRLAGRLSAEARVDWAGSPAQLRVALPSATLSGLQLSDGAGPRATRLAAAAALRLGDAELDLPARRLRVGRLALERPQLALARDAQGRLNAAQWLVASADAAAPATGTNTGTGDRASARTTGRTTARGAAAAVAAPRPWQLQLNLATLQGGQLQWTDDFLAAAGLRSRSLRAEVSGLRLRLQDLRWPAPVRGPLPRLQLNAQVGAPATANRPADLGALAFEGRIGLAPVQASGRLELQRLPLHRFLAYAGRVLPVALLHADASYQGQVALRQTGDAWQLGTGGDLQINEVLVHTRTGVDEDAGTELLSWQSLALQGLDFALAPAARPRLVVREAVLADFFSRLVVTEDGRFNLQDMAATPPAPGASAAAGAAPAAPAGPTAAPAPPGVAAPAPAVAAATAASAASPDDGGLPIDLDLGRTTLRNGRVDFTDRFIRPNYSARLTELHGELGRLRSGTREMASLQLRGRAADTALLEIRGQLNPTARPPALDIEAKATDLELAPLSPYAGKYAGYAIERGKLSMDVAYKIDPDGQLQARNQIILNQLTFGDKVESPSATTLPVRLAVALLKDRHGVIDINLPISGSLNDPQFSLGGLIVKVIVNLLAKALTAPFALLTGGGGPDALSWVDFVPGTVQPTPAGRQVLEKVARALADRPGLTMTVTGHADPLSEHDDLQRAALDERLQAEHRRLALRSGGGAAAAPAAEPASAPPRAAHAWAGDERARALKSLYQRSPLPDKPRNLVGMQRELPEAEMETRLLAAIKVGESAARELALQRGLVVRDALIAAGLPSERLFIAAPRLRPADDASAWTPRAQLALAAH